MCSVASRQLLTATRAREIAIMREREKLRKMPRVSCSDIFASLAVCMCVFVGGYLGVGGVR